jgi:hypothetical protein
MEQCCVSITSPTPDGQGIAHTSFGCECCFCGRHCNGQHWPRPAEATMLATSDAPASATGWAWDVALSLRMDALLVRLESEAR